MVVRIRVAGISDDKKHEILTIAISFKSYDIIDQILYWFYVSITVYFVRAD